MKSKVAIIFSILLVSIIFVSGCIGQQTNQTESRNTTNVTVNVIPAKNQTINATPVQNQTLGVCANEGTVVSLIKSDAANKCCDNLTLWQSGMDTGLSIGNKCYETGLLAGAPYGECINCGNGLCDVIEDACSCPQDCVDSKNSKYKTDQEFCNSTMWTNTISKECLRDSLLSTKPICSICPKEATPPTTTPTVANQSFRIDADDNGFYLGRQITSLSVNKNSNITLAILVNPVGTVYGGLVFKGCGKDSGWISPGQLFYFKFIASDSCSIDLYRPGTNTTRATLQVIAS